MAIIPLVVFPGMSIKVICEVHNSLLVDASSVLPYLWRAIDYFKSLLKAGVERRSSLTLFLNKRELLVKTATRSSAQADNRYN